MRKKQQLQPDGNWVQLFHDTWNGGAAMVTGTKTFISHYHFVARVHVFQIADTPCYGSKSPNKYALHYLKVLYYTSCYYAITMFYAVCRLEFFFSSFEPPLNLSPSPLRKSFPRSSNFKQTPYDCYYFAHSRTCARFTLSIHSNWNAKEQSIQFSTQNRKSNFALLK